MPDYFELPEIPGKPMFRCDSMRASIQVASCSSNWLSANAKGEPPERLFNCHRCPVGAMHAGRPQTAVGAFKGTHTCARCQRTDLRLIRAQICIGCYNREREYIKGANAKGKFPTQHPTLAARTIRFLSDQAIAVLKRPHTISTDELVIEALRDSLGRVIFGPMFGAALPGGQLRLAL
jgi:hypothetical protein